MYQKMRNDIGYKFFRNIFRNVLWTAGCQKLIHFISTALQRLERSPWLVRFPEYKTFVIVRTRYWYILITFNSYLLLFLKEILIKNE